MKLSDYIVSFLVEQKVKHVFGITGGAIAHTFDSLSKNKDIEYICTQHEQAAAMAADAYSRVTGNIGVTVVTSGPGATNILTGVCCSYYDSIPTLSITGQVTTSRLKKEKKIRQSGFQETDVVDIFKPVTKYAKLVEDSKDIRYELEKAIYIAKSGRPGPVLLDIPDDIQRSDINPDELRAYIPEEKSKDYHALEEQIKKCIPLIQNSKRPVIIFGAGIKLGKAEEKAKKFAEILKFPVSMTWAAKDVYQESDPLNAGGFGVASERSGNFVIQNSDLVIALGTRIDTHHTGTPLDTFARGARKIVVDIDENELNKFTNSKMNIDVAINADINDFLNIAGDVMSTIKTTDISVWMDQIKKWKTKYPTCKEEYYRDKGVVNPYVFLEELSKVSREGEIIIADTGANLAQIMSSYKFRKKQTLFSAFNHTPMGYSLPASIGASFAENKRPIICTIGDGGLQMNIQELATIAYHKLPIKIFVFNNKGYGMIKQTQDDWFDSDYQASCIQKGVAVPDFFSIAKAYDLRAERIDNHEGLEGKLKDILASKEAVLCEINICEDQRIIPMLKLGRPIEDSKPLLSRREFLENMIVNPTEESMKEE